jgi:hypothetical protein
MFKRLKVAGACGLPFAVVFSLAAQYVKAQAPGAQVERQVELPIVDKMAPVVVTKITHGDIVVQLGRFIKPVGTAPDPTTPFLADDDWVQNLTIYLLNRTNDTIVSATFNLIAPETMDRVARSLAGFQLHLGRIPSSFAFENGRPVRQPPERQPISFRPGQTLAIHLRDYIDQIKAAVEPTKPLAALTTMDVRFVGFFFASGLRWNGAFRALDPQNFTWRRKDPDYFPGDMDARWPGRPGWIDQQ